MRLAFLSDTGWDNADASLVAEDWAARRFWRLEQGGKTLILMESVPDNHALSTPGHKVMDMIRIGTWLRDIGVHTPAIEDADEDNGFVLMEDLGQQTLPSDTSVYCEAAKVLEHIQAHYTENLLGLPDYQGSHIDRGKVRIVDWLLPLMKDQPNAGYERESFNAIWDKIMRDLPPMPNTFQHCDFHAGNILYLPQEQGFGQFGIIDFQGAHFGPVPYDLVNLVQDIRITDYHDVLPDCCGWSLCHDYDAFMQWYEVLHMQFYCRIAGQLIKLFHLKGDQKFLDYLPGVINGLDTFLVSYQSRIPEFGALLAFLREAGFQNQPPKVTNERIQALVAPDAS